jgi:hypothetical protein
VEGPAVSPGTHTLSLAPGVLHSATDGAVNRRPFLCHLDRSVPGFPTSRCKRQPRMRFSSRKPHDLDQRHGSRQEIRGSAVERSLCGCSLLEMCFYQNRLIVAFKDDLFPLPPKALQSIPVGRHHLIQTANISVNIEHRVLHRPRLLLPIGAHAPRRFAPRIPARSHVRPPMRPAPC